MNSNGNKTSRVFTTFKTFLGLDHVCNVCLDLKQKELMIIKGIVTTLNVVIWPNCSTISPLQLVLIQVPNPEVVQA